MHEDEHRTDEQHNDAHGPVDPDWLRSRGTLLERAIQDIRTPPVGARSRLKTTTLPPFTTALVGYETIDADLAGTPVRSIQQTAYVELDPDFSELTAHVRGIPPWELPGPPMLAADLLDAQCSLWIKRAYENNPKAAACIILHVTKEAYNRYALRVLLEYPDSHTIFEYPALTGTWEELWTITPPSDPAALALHPGPWRDGMAAIPSAEPFRVARAAMLHTDLPDSWTVVGDAAVYREAHDRTGMYLDVQRTGTASAPDAVFAELAAVGGDPLADAYAAIAARYIAEGAPEGGIWVNVDDILRDRGLAPMVVDGRAHGYRTEERIATGKQIAELTRWGISGKLLWPSAKSKRRETLVIDSTLLTVTDTVKQIDIDGTAIPRAVRCTLGSYARHFLTNGAGLQIALLMKTALRYDPKSEQAQKRLAYHLAFRFRLAAYDQDYSAPISIASLFAEAHIIMNSDTQRKNVARTIAGWVRALEHLKRDGVIAGYTLSSGNDEAKHSNLARWLNQRISLDPPAYIRDHYAPIGAHNPGLADTATAAHRKRIPRVIAAR